MSFMAVVLCVTYGSSFVSMAVVQCVIYGVVLCVPFEMQQTKTSFSPYDISYV